MQREFWPDTGQVPSDTMTSAQSEGTTCSESISYAVDFRVRISVLQERVRASTANALDSGANSPESLAKYDPSTSSWKMSQRCLVEDLETFSETWPRSGTMRNGTAYLRPPCAPHIEENGYFWWPTVNTFDAVDMKLRESPEDWIRLNAQCAERNVRKQYPLGVAAKTGLAEMQFKSASAAMRVSMNPLAMLNPIWVEQLMGFPDGWTEVGQAGQANNKRHGKRREQPKTRPIADPESKHSETPLSPKLDTSSGK